MDYMKYFRRTKVSYFDKNGELVKIDGYYPSTTGYNHSRLYFVEKNFYDPQFVKRVQGVVNDYRNLGTYLAVFYVIAIFALKIWMKRRPKYNLRAPLIAWNLLLAAFSIFGTFRIWPEFIHTCRTKGFQYTMCETDFLYGPAGFWSIAFSMSKIAELVDTLFIVLRKQPLIFLHWYHHATILAYCYYWYPEAPSTSRWFGGMNYTVHSVMYSYYALKAMRIRLPKKVSLLVTSLQIVQMITGLYVCCYVLYMKQFDTATYECQTSWRNLKHSFLMYFSYFILFLNFFLQAYVFKGKYKFKIPYVSDLIADEPTAANPTSSPVSLKVIKKQQ